MCSAVFIITCYQSCRESSSKARLEHKGSSMLATMERPQPFQTCQNTLQSVRSPSLHSPRTASIAFPSPNSMQSFGIPSPEHSHYSSVLGNNIITSSRSNNSCVSLPSVYSSPNHYSNEMIDPSMYPNSSAMAAMIPPPCITSVDCYKHDPTCSPSSCSLTSTTLHGSMGSPSGSITPGTPQQQQLGMHACNYNTMHKCACVFRCVQKYCMHCACMHAVDNVYKK